MTVPAHVTLTLAAGMVVKAGNLVLRGLDDEAPARVLAASVAFDAAMIEDEERRLVRLGQLGGTLRHLVRQSGRGVRRCSSFSAPPRLCPVTINWLTFTLLKYGRREDCKEGGV